MALHAVILAGGSGTRFWPLSRELSPKQMLTVFGEDSLIAGAIERGQAVVGEQGKVHIVVGEALFDEVRNHIMARPDLRSASIDYIVEPAARNTAPALALAAASIERDDPAGVIIMLPSDHLVKANTQWQETIATTVEAAATGDLVTIGLVPTRPETGYGYIKAVGAVSPPPASQCHLTGNEDIAPTAYPVEAFIEKPDLAHAQQFIADGNYYWNSGMLVARADAILRELEAAAPENHLIVEAAHQVAAHQDTTSYEKLPKISFDNAALERSHHVSVVPTTIGWSDVGSLLSLEALAEPNKAGTRIIGQGVDIDSTDTLNYSTERLVATLGLDNIMVVDTADATLVASRDRAQDVRLVVDALAQRGAPELKQSQTSLRPWGSWTMLTRGIGYQIKEIVVKGGASLSLQSHTHRSEHWIVVEGTAQVLRGEDELTLDASESVFIPAGTLHRLANPSTTPLRIVEVATGAYLGEDDITRYEDTYGR